MRRLQIRKDAGKWLRYSIFRKHGTDDRRAFDIGKRSKAGSEACRTDSESNFLQQKNFSLMAPPAPHRRSRDTDSRSNRIRPIRGVSA